MTVETLAVLCYHALMEDIFERLTTVKEAARKLRVTTGYVRRLCLKHEIGRVLGRDRLLAGDDLARLEKILKPDG